MPMPTVEPIKMIIEMKISYQATVLIQILVNIAIGEVNGIYENTFINTEFTLPPIIENRTTIKAIMKKKVTGNSLRLFVSSDEKSDCAIAPSELRGEAFNIQLPIRYFAISGNGHERFAKLIRRNIETRIEYRAEQLAPDATNLFRKHCQQQPSAKGRKCADKAENAELHVRHAFGIDVNLHAEPHEFDSLEHTAQDSVKQMRPLVHKVIGDKRCQNADVLTYPF